MERERGSEDRGRVTWGRAEAEDGSGQWRATTEVDHPLGDDVERRKGIKERGDVPPLPGKSKVTHLELRPNSGRR